jgi:hypothetical protein
MRRAMTDPDVREAIANLGVVPLEWDYHHYDEIVGPVFEQLKSMSNALKWEEEELSKLLVKFEDSCNENMKNGGLGGSDIFCCCRCTWLPADFNIDGQTEHRQWRPV